MNEQQGVPVMIHLSALASYHGIPDDPIQMLTSGTLIPGDDYSLLQYREVQQEAETGEVTESDIQLVIRQNQVTMNRVGEYANTMLFQRNKHFETVYHTPFGEMNMTVFTREARWTSGPKDGRIHLQYELSMQGNYASTNELHLEYWISEKPDEKKKVRRRAGRSGAGGRKQEAE